MHVKKIHKGGRPKLDRPRFDLGTPELIAKRISISLDPTLSTCPLDAMLGRRIISQEVHSAATYFLALRKIVFGKATPQAIDLLAVSGGSTPDEVDLPQAENGYREACAAMRRKGERTFWTVENILVHEVWPQWLTAPKSVHWESRLCMIGLGALRDWYEGKNKR